MTAPSATAAAPSVRQRYSAERATFGGVSLVTMHGTLNEDFDGRKLAATTKTNKIVLHMRDVQRYASWGMTEWMDFLRLTAECDVYIVECSTYAMSQLNLVTGLMGQAKLVSFYTNYVCRNCGAEKQTLFVIPRDLPLIRDVHGTTQECATCGGRAKLEEYPAALFDTVGSRPPFDIDDEVLAFMRSHLQYDISPDLTRFRALRRVQKEYTYVRLTGNIAGLPPDVLARAANGVTVVDLEGVVFDPAQLSAWRSFVQTAMPRVRSLQLLNCPPRFLEAGAQIEQLRDKLKVRTFGELYRCGTCDAVTTSMIDVATNLEQLAIGIVPAARCQSCRSSVDPTPTDVELDVLRALPARDRDIALDQFLTKVRAEPNEKLENCLATLRSEPKKREGGIRAVHVAAGLGVVLLAAAGGLVVKLVDKHDEPKKIETVLTPPIPDKPRFVRPDWIVSGVPASGYCHDMLTHIMCVGVSAYHANRDDAVAEANDVALEELVSAVGIKVTDPFFRDRVMPLYSQARAATLQPLLADPDHTDPKAEAEYQKTLATARAARARVVAALKTTGGAAVPTGRADWYWEQFDSDTSDTGTEFLVFIRYDLSMDAMRALVDKYSRATTVADASVTTAFPGLAWPYATLTGGAIIMKSSKQFANAGLDPLQIIVAAEGKPVTDASGLADAVDQWPHHEVGLTVAMPDGSEKKVTVKKK